MAFQSFPEAVESIAHGGITLQAATTTIYNQLNEKERLNLLDGDISDFLITVVQEGYCYKPWSAGRIPRLQIPGLLFSDGPRGSLLGGKGTAFPTSSSRANTFDPDLEQRIVSLLLLVPYACNSRRLTRI
jgi:beta-glucosidase